LTTGDEGDTNQGRSTMSNAVRSSTFRIVPSKTPATRVPKNIQSIERAAAILRLLSGRTRRLGVVDLAGELGLPKGTVHGLLRTLQHVGFVEQDEETGKYQLGAALLHMGSSYLDGNELRTRALNWSDSLAARTNESVRIGTLHEGQVLIVHHVFRPDDSLQTLDVGALLPAHASALGKILLAHHAYAAAELARHGLESFTPATITDPEALERELERVRKRGWAADIGELVNGEVSCAAPILDRRGVTVGAMGVSGPPDRLLAARQPRGDVVAFVREAARAVSRELGAIPW
jgi:DNA-binding IclR family transcriptional regulator